MDNIIKVNFNLNKRLTTCLYNDNILEASKRAKICACCEQLFRYACWNKPKYCNKCIIWRKKKNLSID